MSVIIEKCYKHSDVTFQESARKGTVYALAFKGKKKQLILNATNRKTLTLMFGPYPSEWRGKEITLYSAEIRAFGEGRTNGIVIRRDSRRWDGTHPDKDQAIEHDDEYLEEFTPEDGVSPIIDPFPDDA